MELTTEEIVDIILEATWRLMEGDKKGHRFYGNQWTGRYGSRLESTSIDKYTREDGTLDPTRAELHKQWAASFLSGHQSHEHPIVRFTGGGAGSGKSTRLAVMHEETPDMVEISADTAKGMIPEFQEGVKEGDPTVAVKVHDESGMITDIVKAEVAAKKYNAVLDGIGNTSMAHIRARVKPFLDAGYEFGEAVYVTIPTATAIQRARDRANNPKSSSFGRRLPSAIIKQTHQGVSNVWPELAASGIFKKLSLWDNSGKEHVKIASVDNGVLTILDKALYARFLRKKSRGGTSTTSHLESDTAKDTK